MLWKCPQFGGQNHQNLRFLEFLKKWKMANFKSKNLCDESSKIKILRWQFSCIFRWLRRGILRFFCRRRFHGENPRSKSPVLKNFKKVKNWVFLYGKIRPLEMIFFAFFPTYLLGLSERYVLDPRTLIGDSKWGFPATIAKRSYMIIFDHFTQCVKGLSEFSPTYYQNSAPTCKLYPDKKTGCE